MMRCLAALLVAGLLAACSPSGAGVGEEAQHARELAAASKEARAKLAYFWDRFEAPPPGAYDFALKAMLPRGDGEAGAEEVWVWEIARAADSVSGALRVEPRFQPGLARGDRVRFAPAAIIDWAFMDGDKLIGHYTTRVLLDRMPPDEADIMRALLGENPQ